MPECDWLVEGGVPWGPVSWLKPLPEPVLYSKEYLVVDDQMVGWGVVGKMKAWIDQGAVCTWEACSLGASLDLNGA